MPYKDPEKQKAAQRKHYLKQKALGRNSGNQAKQHRKEFVLRYKMLPSVKCSCGEDRWQCLQFHHRPGEKKVDSIVNMCRRGINMKDLKAEIRKCNVVCANCHAVAHNGYIWDEQSTTGHDK